MSGIQVFFVAFAVSYVGSVPPGSINVSVMQLSVKGQKSAAWALAFGAVLIELVYAGTAVAFLQLLMESEQIFFILKLITGMGLLTLGIINLLNQKETSLKEKDTQVNKRTGFSKGLVLGLINPLTIPFWLGLTTYLLDHAFISISGQLYVVYLVGLGAGTFALLITVELLGSRFRQIASNTFAVHTLPGILFALMGLYYLITLWAAY